MSHVDEGTLHAYFDGELPPHEQRDLEAHLAQCATCKERLAEERALFERASALLGSARPVERPAPPFERLRPTPKRSPWHIRTPVAWAASIMLALGLGYYLREPGIESGPDQAVSGLLQQRAAPVAEEAKTQIQEPANADKATRPRAPETRAIEVAAATDRASVDSLLRGEANSGVVALQPQVHLRGAAPAQAAPTLRDQAIRLDGAIVTTAPPAPAALPAAEGERARLGAASARRDESRSVRNLVSTTWPLISRGAAASLLGDKPVGVPGLATRGIRRSPGADSTVVVEQALDSATVIQIFQRPATARNADSTVYFYDGNRLAREAAPAAARAPADRLARFVGKLRVEISGPVSTDSLNRLLEQVAPLP